MKTRVLLAGATGWVGRALVAAIAAAEDLELSAAVARTGAGERLPALLGPSAPDVVVSASVAHALERSPSDVLVDYTGPDVVKANLSAAIEHKLHAVVGTSGLSDADYEDIDRAARAVGVGVLAAGNFAVTAVLLLRFAEWAARLLPACEIIDYGSAAKPDAPSGTARELAWRVAQAGARGAGRAVADTIGLREARGATLAGTQMHSVRLPGYVSSIEALFGLPEERLSIRHDASGGPGPYVAGTLLAVRRVGRFTGLRRGLDQVLDLPG
jgi:4-hydroxy-tetrahydrodipicolinate reductase